MRRLCTQKRCVYDWRRFQGFNCWILVDSIAVSVLGVAYLHSAIVASNLGAICFPALKPLHVLNRSINFPYHLLLYIPLSALAGKNGIFGASANLHNEDICSK